MFSHDDKDNDDFLKDLNKKREKREELKEQTKYRKQCAIEKLEQVLHSPIVELYNTSGLTTQQRLIILQLIRRIYECEGKIPEKYWCDDCKSKGERIKDLSKRFAEINLTRNWKF